MSIRKETPLGGITLSSKAIASVAGDAVSSCYGVIGIAPRGSLLDSALKILNKENYDKGIFASKGIKGYQVDIYIYCPFGIKLTEVASEVQKRVRYELEKTFGIKFQEVNVFVSGLKETA